MKFSIICILLLTLASITALAEDLPAAQPAAEAEKPVQNPLGGTGPMTPEKLAAARTEITAKATRLLDTFVGTYKAECTIDGVASVVDLAIQPKTLNDNYYMGSYSVKPAGGGPGYEAFTVFCFNGGAMSYLFFYFGNDSYIRNYLGTYSDNEVMVQSPYPGGMEYIRWSMADEDTLKHETWKPKSKSSASLEGDPDQIILLKRVK